jgi:hypothetical protein
MSQISFEDRGQVRAVRSPAEQLSRAHGPDPCVGFESDARVPFATQTLVVWLEGRKTIMLLPTVA